MLPPEINNVYLYEIFNTASWSIVLGTPMLLYFQHLDGTATILALAACLCPALNILQIPAARFIEKVGYRRFVLSGWITRSFIVVGMMLVTILPSSIGKDVHISLMLGLSFIYNVLRGISVSGLLPWFAHIVPEGRRGEFLAKDQLSSAVSAVTTLFLAGKILHYSDRWHPFTVIFAMAAGSAFVSLMFLRRIPDVPVEDLIRNSTPVPWKEILFYPRFLTFLRYNFITNLALGASGVFFVRFLRTRLNVTESNVLFIAAFSTVSLAMGLVLVGPLIDRAGNKPALTVSGVFLICHFLCLGTVAAQIIPYNFPVICVQVVTFGLGMSLWNLANLRMAIGLAPVMGRPHFLALYSVVSNLTVGIVPLFWGPWMDYLDHWKRTCGYWHWNNYSLFYCMLALVIALGLITLRWVPEAKTMTWNVFAAELLVIAPSRRVFRLVAALRTPITVMRFAPRPGSALRHRERRDHE